MADPTVTSHHGIAPKTEPGATVNITLDGREITVEAGQFLIKAAEDAGVYIPRFCYHPRLEPVGMCRMCLVEVSGPRGATLQPACYIPVSDGMVVDTTSEKVHKAQDGVLEFLLVNHPLDCPVCDKGGECPLQDQTLAYGPGESRFIEEKRHFAKPISLSSLVLLDRERCIQCGRCTRFALEVAGEAMIDFLGRGDGIEVAIAEDHVFGSIFSGNTVQICPVGALTSAPYRFTARPWDLDQVESTCTTCSFGCRAAVQSSANRVTRLLGIDSEPVNQSWLCDKGRYGYEVVDSDERISSPYMRTGRRGAGAAHTAPADTAPADTAPADTAPAGTGPAGAEPVGWSEALRTVAGKLAEIKENSGPDAIGFIGGARLTNEDAYAWTKLAKGVIGTDSVDAQLGDGLEPELVLSLPRATVDETCSAKCVIALAGDLHEELPVLYLRLRAAAEDGLPIVEITPRRTHLSPQAAATLLTAPGKAAGFARGLARGTSARPAEIAETDWADAVGAMGAVGADGAGLVVIVGRGSVAESADLVGEAATALAEAYPAAKFLPALRRGNVMGALDMGMAPGLLPGRVSLEAGRDWYASEPGWGEIPTARGRDTAQMLQALADGSMRAVVLVGADPIGDFPDLALAVRALERAELVVAVDSFHSASVGHADVVLPAAMNHEKSGTTTNVEGRVLRVGQMLTPPVLAWPDWMIAAELAFNLGSDLAAASVGDLWEEIARLSPAHVGLTRAVLDSPAARDGVVVPLSASKVVLGRRFDPMATPGIESVEVQGPIERVGAAEPVGWSADEGRAADGRAEGGHGAPERPSGRPPLLARQVPDGARQAGRPLLVTDPPAEGRLRLVATRRIYDHGVQMLGCESLAGLVGPLVARVSPLELTARSLVSASTVRLVSGRGNLSLQVIADPGVAQGVVEVSANVHGGAGQPGEADSVESLIDARGTVTDVEMVAP